uniref:DUF4187 domain-containing protein n=1 Tax=Oryza brachyantha TaxID=4533 RepID=J3MUB0_ORYBR
MFSTRARQSTQWRSRRVVRDYRKAEAALAQLENREVAPPPPEGEEKEKTAEEEEVITEEDLQNILAKLRGEHYYCLYCGCKEMLWDRVSFRSVEGYVPSPAMRVSDEYFFTRATVRP